jgi:hypothetical protein
VQRSPDPGATATHETEARVLYDEDALYVGLRMHDDRPHAIAAQLGRRDDQGLFSDWIHVAFDSYYDRRTAFRFAVNPAGVQVDAFHFNDSNDDDTWDAVWESATSVDSLGWVAELRIPLSQLRFARRGGGPERWGFQVSRETARNGEEVYWSPTPPDQPGLVSRFGDLAGLDSIGQPRRLELAPYAASQLTRVPGSRDDPFWSPNDVTGRAGLDMRYGVTPSLTLTATINPDFGQVEADPAVVNLSAFETQFDERRPFFLEGIDLFRFGGSVTFNDNNPSQFFYTRRIGRAPHRSLDGDGIAYTDVPRQSSILGAAKLSGKTASGWSLGLLGALTAEETGRLVDDDGRQREEPVEPRTTFFVSRLRRDFRQGRTVLGSMVSGARRDLNIPEFRRLLVRDALVGGIDWEHAWAGRDWTLSGFLAGTRVTGDPQPILALQRSSARYLQRPDARHLTLDSTRTDLTGYFGTVSFAKTGGEHWRGSITYEETSPEFELNDVGFQQRADDRSLSTSIQYRQDRIGRLFREYSTQFDATMATNFDGNVLQERYTLVGNATLRNFWDVSGVAQYAAAALNDRLTRGGPLTREPAWWRFETEIESDSRHPLSASLSVSHRGDDAGGFDRSAELDMGWRVTSALFASLEPSIEHSYSRGQFVTSVGDALATSTYGRRYVFGDIRQREVSLEARVEWTFSPRLTLQLVGEPFVANGRFERFKQLRAPRTYRFDVYGEDIGTLVRDAEEGEVTVDPDGPGAASAFTFGERDFTVRSLRGNAVLRWEYRPGSTLFLVWQQQREGEVDRFVPGATGRLTDVFRQQAENLFLLKVTYWLGQ